MPRRTISLLTDFGSQSPYVGIMKGVIYGINPEVNILDLSHDITPHNIGEAAFVLDTAWRYLPQRCIHVVVVDPGVGSNRKALIGIGDRGVYIAPDNGVLSYVLANDDVTIIHEINAEHYRLQPVSNTFHGRDVFAPAAAWLTLGIELASFGDPLPQPVTFPVPRPRAEGSTLIGQVMHVDRFGNLITNLSKGMLENVLEKYGLRGFVAGVGNAAVERHIQFFGQAEPGGLASIFGSSQYLEIIARESNAAQKLGATVGTQVMVRFHK